MAQSRCLFVTSNSNEIWLQISKQVEEVCFVSPDPNEYLCFTPEALTGIVFGAKMPPKYQTGFKFLVKTLKQWEHVSFYSAKLDPKKYVVNIV